MIYQRLSFIFEDGRLIKNQTYKLISGSVVKLHKI